MRACCCAKMSKMLKLAFGNYIHFLDTVIINYKTKFILMSTGFIGNK